MTKCRAHPYEHGVGVCASCLRERLLAVVTARGGAHSPELDWNFHHSPPPPLPPPPLDFPRSVSPYASRRRHQPFFSTPQVGPTFDYDVTGRKKRSTILSLLFGPGTGSRSWFLGRRRRKEKQLPDRPVRFPVSGRGMSPNAESACSSGYTTESSTSRSRPDPTSARRLPAASSGRGGIGVSGIAMCLSPLVRPNPKPAADAGFVGGVGGVGDLHRRERRQASLGPSRSRKLADVGRFR